VRTVPDASLALRHSLSREARGSTRLKWTMAATSSPRDTGLRYRAQLFTGYDDGLLDYDRRRTALSLRVSLVDW